jgi:Helicase HerA, central domain
MSGLFLGESVDPATHQRNGTRIELDPASFTTHGVIVGQTGSGKTGLGIVLIEEALLSGVPVILIDPKGDLANLALRFPGLSGPEFEPWIEGGGAEAAATAAKQWSDGLASWGLDGARIAALKAAADVAIYTPGSSDGIPLNLVGSLAPPPGALDDEESRIDEVGSVVSGLLALCGIESDPLSGREHILLTNLLDRAWAAGETVDISSLVGQVLTPPFRKLGVLELEAFFPAKDRQELVMKLNGLLASPSFAAWAKGAPLDIDSLLHTPDGRPKASIISIAHLSDEERQFALTTVLGRLVSWMRKQSGTSNLRALLYIDEVFGFVPPTAAPPTKKPILTLLKQARAFGVGVVLATQNPVDVDYKALSNAATWMVGRLQTERDRDRLLDGMRSAAGGVDIDALAATISGLAKREFVLHRSGQPKPSVFTSRWTMTYLRGPLTGDQLKALTKDAPERQVTPAQSGTPAATSEAPALSEEHVPLAPSIAKGTSAYFLSPDAPWAATVNAKPGGTSLEAAIVARCVLTFDDAKLGLHETEEWEAIFHPVAQLFDPTSAVAVDYDDRDLIADAPADARFALPGAPLDNPAWFRAVTKLLTDHLVATHTLPLRRNDSLKLWARVGESAEDFATRCDGAAQAKADDEAAKVRTSLTARIEKLNSSIDLAQRKVEETKSAAKSSRAHELIAGAGDLLGAFLGGRRNVRSITRSVGNAVARAGQSSNKAERLETAEATVASKLDELHVLETDLHDQLFAIDAKWDEVGRQVTEVPIALERTDVSVRQLSVLWLPVA